MSGLTEDFNNGRSAQFNRNTGKIFIGENRYEPILYTNSGYTDVTLVAGQPWGRITTSGQGLPLKSDAVDGSQIPLGILRDDHIVEAGDTVTVYICVAGDVAEEEITLAKSGDTLNTVISSRRLRDRIAADTLGIKIVATADDLTGYDNDLE